MKILSRSFQLPSTSQPHCLWSGVAYFHSSHFVFHSVKKVYNQTSITDTPLKLSSKDLLTSPRTSTWPRPGWPPVLLWLGLAAAWDTLAFVKHGHLALGTPCSRVSSYLLDQPFSVSFVGWFSSSNHLWNIRMPKARSLSLFSLHAFSLADPFISMALNMLMCRKFIS